MALTDVQIERYSRQILLPEIGGHGQEKLLRSTATVVGVGSLAKAIVPYLAGAGIGRLLVRPGAGEEASAAAQLAARAVQINPDVRADVDAPLGTVEAGDPVRGDVLCEASGRPDSVLSLVRSAYRSGAAVVAGGSAASWGWTSMTRARASGPGCAFCGWLAARRGCPEESTSPFTPTVIGGVAALIAASVLEALLDLHPAEPRRWLRYEAETMTLDEHAITRREDCPVCGDGTGEKPCHPTLDS